MAEPYPNLDAAVAAITALRSQAPPEVHTHLDAWASETEKLSNITISEPQLAQMQAQKQVLRDSILEVAKARAVVDKHYNLILGAQNCRIYYRERRDVGSIMIGAGVSTVTDKNDFIRFIQSICKPMLKNTYISKIAEIGGNYFYVWGLQRSIHRGPVHPGVPHGVNEAHVADDVDYFRCQNPFERITPIPRARGAPPKQAVNAQTQAEAFVCCVKEALNSFLHGNVLAREVFHPMFFDLQALERVATLTADQRDYLQHMCRYLNVDLNEPVDMKKKWLPGESILHFKRTYLRTEWEQHRNLENLDLPYVHTSIMDDILAWETVKFSTSDSLTDQFTERCNISTMVGAVDGSFWELRRALQDTPNLISNCDEIQKGIVQLMNPSLQSYRRYYLLVHGWYMTYLTYIKIFRATELIRAMVSARYFVECCIPEQFKLQRATKNYAGFLQSIPAPHPWENRREYDLLNFQRDIFGRLSDAMDGQEPCDLFNKEVFPVCQPDPARPPNSNRLEFNPRCVPEPEILICDSSASKYNGPDIGVDPYSNTLPQVCIGHRVVRLFEARSIPITLYQPRLPMNLMPTWDQYAVLDENADTTPDFICPVADVFHYMIKCAFDNKTILLEKGKNLNPRMITPQASPYCKLHNYGNRELVHHQVARNGLSACLVWDKNLAAVPRKPPPLENEWNRRFSLYPGILEAQRLVGLRVRPPAPIPNNILFNQADIFPPVGIPDWVARLP